MFDEYLSEADAYIFETMGKVDVILSNEDGSASGTIRGIIDSTQTQRFAIGDHGPENANTLDVSCLLSEINTVLSRSIQASDRITFDGVVYVVTDFNFDDSVVYITAELITDVARYGDPERRS